ILATLTLLVSALPITPSAPHLRKRAEQFRLQGLKEFEIAQRLSTSPSLSPSTSSWRTRLSTKMNDLLDSSQQEEEDFSGDIAPGSLDAPQLLPTASSWETDVGVWGRLCALFVRAESSFGYEGKELELRRPQGGRSWKLGYGRFRR
ncbi:hypothetical protein BDW02DRAFT_474778, partial [Decorospora gaudefroyi]